MYQSISFEEQFKILFNDELGNLMWPVFIYLIQLIRGHRGEGEMETLWERKLSTLGGTRLSGEHGPGYRSGKSFSLSDSPCFNKQADNA